VPSLKALGIAKGKAVFGLTDHRIGRMMKSQLWLMMEVNGQMHAVSTVHSGEETPAPTGQKTT
jgi:hypothetical protein